MRVRLTRQVVEKTTSPIRGQLFLRDTVIEGFNLRITSKGIRSFTLEARVHGRNRRITIGQYPEVAVDRAREVALKLKGEIAEGRDPVEERRRSRQDLTLRELVEQYASLYGEPRRATWPKDRQRIEKYARSLLRHRCSAITPVDASTLHRRIGERHGHVIANRVLEILRTVVRWGLGQGVIEGLNPWGHVRRYRELPRERFLRPDELRRVVHAINEEREPWRTYFLLLLLTGCRKGEILSARWRDVDLAAQELHVEKTKNGRAHIVPLVEEALALLQSLPRDRGNDHLFPGKGTSGHLAEPKFAWDRICRRAEVKDVRIHDLRRTVGASLVAHGHSLQVVSRILNHRDAGVTSRIYAPLDRQLLRETLTAHAGRVLAQDTAPTTPEGELRTTVH